MRTECLHDVSESQSNWWQNMCILHPLPLAQREIKREKLIQQLSIAHIVPVTRTDL